MNLRQIREEAWGIAGQTTDIDEDRLWTKAEMNRYINRVYRYIARETKCIRDATTTSVCRITSRPPADLAELTALAASYSWYADDLVRYNNLSSWLYQTLVAPNIYALSPLIIDIHEIKWTNYMWRLQKVSVTKWQKNPLWEEIVGMPTEYATDYSNNTIVINFRHNTQETMKLLVSRMPLADLVADGDVPEFRLHYHDFMINGVLAQMYAKQDAEAFDMAKAADYEAKYAADVDEIKQQETIIHQRLQPNYALEGFR